LDVFMSRSEAGADAFGLPAATGNPFSVRVPQVPVFSAARLDEILAGIFSLRDHWREHGPGFFSLGIAHYKEGRDGTLDDLDVEESNALLEGTFGPALNDLATFLARELDGEVEWGAGLPLPGFHVLDATHLQAGQPVGDSHFDLQYAVGRFDGPVRATLSYTVPIQVPEAGASLDYWPVDFAEVRRLIEAGELVGVADAERHFPMRTVQYEPGKACLQYGLPLHRMGAISRVAPTDHRITMQGHAALVGDRWIAYW
jgi:hypothetical protein